MKSFKCTSNRFRKNLMESFGYFILFTMSYKIVAILDHQVYRSTDDSYFPNSRFRSIKLVH